MTTLASTVIRQGAEEHRADRFECVDCGYVFPTGKAFSDHFVRKGETIEIVTCKGGKG